MTEEQQSQVQIASSAVVCAEAKINGEVTVGDGCVLDPHVVIDAQNGPIIIGVNNIFEEHAVIRNTGDGQPMIIGDSNIFEVQSVCNAKYVGSRNIIGTRSKLGDGCFVADDCNIGIGCEVAPKHTLEPFVHVYSPTNSQRKTVTPNLDPTLQLELMRKLLPSYHHLYGKKPRAAAGK